MINDKVTVYTDGGSRNNPGPAALGAVIRFGEREERIKKYLGKMTNNEAEYLAVVHALKKTRELLGRKRAKENEVELFTDSQLVVKQMNHEYKIKDKRMQEFFIEIWNLVLDFKKVSFIHVLREKNKVADSLVNEALDEQNSKFDF